MADADVVGAADEGAATTDAATSEAAAAAPTRLDHRRTDTAPGDRNVAKIIPRTYGAAYIKDIDRIADTTGRA